MAERSSKSINNWQRYPSSKCYKSDDNLRFGIWRSAVAQPDSTEKNDNIGAQLQSIRCTKAPKILENLVSVLLLGCTNLFVPSIFGLPERTFDNCCQSYIASCGKKNLYRPKTTAVKFYSNLSAIYMKWCAQTFPQIFGLFEISDRN